VPSPFGRPLEGFPHHEVGVSAFGGAAYNIPLRHDRCNFVSSAAIGLLGLITVPDRPKSKDSDASEPLGAYQEWSEHRYDPRHYLGGNLAPHLDKARLGKSARRKAGQLLALMALMTILAAAASWQDSGALERAAWLGLAALTTAAAVRMYRP